MVEVAGHVRVRRVREDGDVRVRVRADVESGRAQCRAHGIGDEPGAGDHDRAPVAGVEGLVRGVDVATGAHDGAEPAGGRVPILLGSPPHGCGDAGGIVDRAGCQECTDQASCLVLGDGEGVLEVLR